MTFKKWIRLIVVCVTGVTGVVSVTGTGCVPAVFHTADVSRGYEVTVGGGYLDYGYPTPQGFSSMTGGHVELSAQYGFSDRIALIGSVSFKTGQGYNYSSYGEYLAGEQTQYKSAFQAAFQYELIEKPSLSLLVIAGFPNMFSLGLAKGIDIGNREIITLGIGSMVFQPLTVTCTIHPLPRFHIYGGTGIDMPWCWRGAIYVSEVSAGIGYNFISKKR